LKPEPITAEAPKKESHKSEDFDTPILLEKSSSAKKEMKKSQNIRKEGKDKLKN